MPDARPKGFARLASGAFYEAVGKMLKVVPGNLN
jgi:hypothetical protein